MATEHWERVQHLLELALAQPDDARSAFIDQACAGEPELRDELRSMLRGESAENETLPAAWLDALTGASSLFASGDLVAGRYEIRGLLGRGGMGEVYEAWDGELSIPVALKTLNLTGGSDQEHRLKREGLLARSISHPNVCRVFDLGRHGDGGATVWFLTMEVLRGQTLAERLRTAGKLPLDHALHLAIQMAAGLGAAHRAGVVHRDFKSGNVMLVRGGAGERAVVTDFGIAQVALAEGTAPTDEDEQELQAGTPSYMAPEQVRGERVGPAADIYALGIVLYEVLTGELPFAGGSAMEIAKRRLVEEPPSPRSVMPELDERWDAVILRCLAREPRRRFGRVEDVVAALSGRAVAEEIETLQTAGRGWHTLPVERDTFIGREQELEELKRNLAGTSPVVTLLGAGGMGKTRLAVRYGWRGLGEWPGGVWFGDLTGVRDLNGIASAVAGPLGVQLGRGDPIEVLGHAIAGRGRCLVILDNFEQVVEQAGATVGRWTAKAVEARFLVTSRSRLGLDGETVQVVGPLSSEQGTALFTARARWLCPGLELTGKEGEAARELVRLVEGMPLAIELAAGRMRVMSASQIVEQMRRRFQLLTGGHSDRHETLTAVIDGSWELLRPWEKSALAQCSVFEGGFTLEAAERVLDLRGWPEAPWVVDVVQSLVDKCVLRMWVPEPGVRGDRPEARFGMYVSVQEYARERLGEMGVEAERGAEERHGRWYARYGTDEALEAIDRHGGIAQGRELERELENLVAACLRGVTRGDGATAGAAYVAGSVVLMQCGPLGKAVALGRSVLEMELGREERARTLRRLGAAERLAGRMEEARADFDAALAISREVGNRRAEGVVLWNLGALHREQGRVEEARAHFEAALAIHREVGDQRSEGIVLDNLGQLHGNQGRMEEARVHFEAALAIHREVGNRRSEGLVLGNLGLLYLDQGRMEEARSYSEAALAIDREVGDRRNAGIVLGNLGGLHHEQGRMEEARAHYEAALVIHREVGNWPVEGVVLGDLGSLHRDQGRIEEARAHYEAALVIHREVRNRRSEGVVLGYLGNLHRDQGRIEESRDVLERAEAILRRVGYPIGLAMVLCTRAELEQGTGNVAAARAALHEAQQLAEQAGAGPESELGRQLAKAQQAVHPSA